MSAAPWILKAESYLGQHEIAGGKDNAFIVECIRRCGGAGDMLHDETAWCAAFGNFCLEEVGVRGTKSLAALSVTTRSDIFMKLPGFKEDCIIIFDRVDPSQPNVAHGHFSFGLRCLNKNAIIIGGNQNNCVCVETRTLDKVHGYYWPVGVP